MPAWLQPAVQLSDQIAAAATARNGSAVENGTAAVLQVVCAWPVSGQYGPGSRILYYVLVAACVLAQDLTWLRSACLAALIFPAVAAIHGIVLAAMHVDGAVDMDIFGAFQLCSIGILAAPVTVQQSSRYFHDPGRNLIFVWTGLVLAGMLSLTVEFFRATPSPCPFDNAGNPISPEPSQFSYNPNITCGLVCLPNNPVSPLRLDAANNIYVIPAPDKLDFGTAALLSAACCIPPVLLLVTTFNKILEIHFKNRASEQREDATAEGTAERSETSTPAVSAKIREILKAIQIPLFGGLVVALVIFGERNLWSQQVLYQTEPIGSIGQWAPIVGTGIGVLGSLYVIFLAPHLQISEKPNGSSSDDPEDPHSRGRSSGRPSSGIGSPTYRHFHPSHPAAPPLISAPPMAGLRRPTSSPRNDHDRPTSDGNGSGGGQSNLQMVESAGPARDYGGRRAFANTLDKFAKFVVNAADTFDDSEFRRGKAVDFPRTPGEEFRNRDLPGIESAYNPARDADGAAIPGSSRAHSVRSPSVVSERREPASPRSDGPDVERARMGSGHRRVGSYSTVGDGEPVRRDTLTVPSHNSYGPGRS